MNEYLSKKSVAFYINVAVVVLSVLAMITYIFANKEASALVPLVYIFAVISIAVAVLGVVNDLYGVPAIILPALCWLCAVLTVVDNATAFMLQFNGVAQGTGEMGAPNVAFWICIVSFILAGVAATSACLFKQNKN